MTKPTSDGNGVAGDKTKVIIVGAGFGGLTAAVECHRRGLDVEIYEAFPELKVLGDIISFGPNAGRIFARWQQVDTDESIAIKLKRECIDLSTYGFRIHKYDTGEVVAQQPASVPSKDAPTLNGHRGELHEIVFNYVKDQLGVPIHLGQRVAEYFETDNGAGIILENGEKVHGDCVIGADGVRSKARELVLGYEDKPKSSGYAIWRAWFPSEKLAEDPRTAEFCDQWGYLQWLDRARCTLPIFHAQGRQSWSFPGKIEDVLEMLADWDPMCSAIVEKTPSVVDWKLVYREPLPHWVSSGGRIALIGDAAHPFLPTSVQGASQAMEDGVTIAACIEKAGISRIPEALQAFQDIRYERVCAVQKTGESTRERWHKADWKKAKQDPDTIKLPREDWILQHDAERHASEVLHELFGKA
ncbi:hypothetical protein G7054_g2962 [Neopestalotiopsis clavispora]|nr:hypothetical protein G7054_g2962 [Neopestalotiopsis clavispora]